MSGGKRLRDAQLSEVVYVAESGIHGKGVFAARGMGKGEYIGTFHGPEARRDGTYVLWVYEEGRGDLPVGRRGRNVLRFLNHAARCNAEFTGFDLYARRAIRRGDEITIDYGDAE